MQIIRTIPQRTDPPENTLCEKALKSLAKRIRGYTLKEVKTTYEYDTAGNKRVKSEVVTCKQVAPDLAALTFALTNLDPQRWNTKLSAVAGGGDSTVEEAPDLSLLSESALREISGLLEA